MQSLNKPIILFDIDYTLFSTAFFKESGLTRYELYPEVLDALEQLFTIATLGIFSEGEKEFQKKKLRETKIEGFFDKRHIYIQELKEERIKELSEIYAGARLFLVEDKLHVLSVMKKFLPATITVWIKRGEYAQKQKAIADFVPDAVLDDLSKLPQFISSFNS